MRGPWTNCFLLRHSAMISEIFGTTRMPNRQIAAIVSSHPRMKGWNITLRRRKRPTELGKLFAGLQANRSDPLGRKRPTRMLTTRGIEPQLTARLTNDIV